MANYVFCNRCFQGPHNTSRFSLTNCGHVYCDLCLCKGKKDECLICKAPCRTVSLSKHGVLKKQSPIKTMTYEGIFWASSVEGGETDSSIQAFFMGIDSLCTKYSKETLQISEFQDKHRRRLYTFYREKISKLEDSLRKAVLEIEQLQRVRSSQQPAFNTMKTSMSTPSAKPNGYLLFPPSSSALESSRKALNQRFVFNRAEAMEVDVTPSPMRRPEVAAGPMRMSLISPPQDGRMGSVSHRGLQHPGLTPSQASMSKSLRIPPLQTPSWGPSQMPPSQSQGRAARKDTPSLGDPQALPSSQPLARRPPISIARLLQRQNSGSSHLGGLTQER